MRWHGRRETVCAYGVPTDMRKGFDGLGALVSQRFGQVFRERHRPRSAVLASTLTGEFAGRPERLDSYSAWQGAADNILR